LYTFAGWGAYLGLWYAQLLPQMSGHRPNSRVEKAVKGFPAILGPIMYVTHRLLSSLSMTNLCSRILFSRRIVQLWYNRKGNAEGMWRRSRQPRVGLVPTSLLSEKSLAALKLSRRNKVEDFKKRTNYYETRELLERYEDGPSAGPPSARPIDMASRRQSQLLATPQRAVPAVPQNTPTNLPNPPVSPGLQSQLARMYQDGVLVVLHISHTHRSFLSMQRSHNSLSRPRASSGTTSLPMHFLETMSHP
jgi:hypothetical protein